MVKHKPRIVHALSEQAMLVNTVDVNIETIERGDYGVGDGPELGLVLRLEGRLNKTRRKRSTLVVLDREMLVEMLTKLAHAGGGAYREFPFELMGAIEAGLERLRRDGMA